jgi:hypothetical protein
MVRLDEVEQFAENQKASVASLPMVFTFGPEWCWASLRNAVQFGRNPQAGPAEGHFVIRYSVILL